MTYRFDPVLDCSARDADRDGFCSYGTAVVSRFSMRAATARDYSCRASARRSRVASPKSASTCGGGR